MTACWDNILRVSDNLTKDNLISLQKTIALYQLQYQAIETELRRWSKYNKEYTLHDYKYHHKLLKIFGISLITTNAASLIYIVLHKVSKRLGSIRQIYCKSRHITEGKRGMSNLRISATNNIVCGLKTFSSSENIYDPFF